jgi:adenosylcobinamide-phosphate synthase
MFETIQSQLLVFLAGATFSLFLGGPMREYIGLPLRRFVHARIRILGEKLNQRSIADRVWRGLIILGLMLIPCILLDFAIGSGFFAAIIIAATADLQPILWQGWSAVKASKNRNLGRLHDATSALALEPQSAPDHHGQLRLIIMSITHHFAIVVVGGAFWFGLLGLTGLLAYYMLATAAHYFREEEEKWRAFGWAATRLFSLVNALPSFISALLLLAASFFVPRAKPFAGLKAYMDAKNEHHQHLIAGALGIALGGPRIINGLVTQVPWIGKGSAQLEGNDLARFMTLFSIALFGFVILLLFIVSQ